MLANVRAYPDSFRPTPSVSDHSARTASRSSFCHRRDWQRHWASTDWKAATASYRLRIAASRSSGSGLRIASLILSAGNRIGPPPSLLDSATRPSSYAFRRNLQPAGEAVELSQLDAHRQESLLDRNCQSPSSWATSRARFLFVATNQEPVVTAAQSQSDVRILS